MVVKISMEGVVLNMISIYVTYIYFPMMVAHLIGGGW